MPFYNLGSIHNYNIINEANIGRVGNWPVNVSDSEQSGQHGPRIKICTSGKGNGPEVIMLKDRFHTYDELMSNVQLDKRNADANDYLPFIVSFAVIHQNLINASYKEKDTSMKLRLRNELSECFNNFVQNYFNKINKPKFLKKLADEHLSTGDIR